MKLQEIYVKKKYVESSNAARTYNYKPYFHILVAGIAFQKGCTNFALSLGPLKTLHTLLGIQCKETVLTLCTKASINCQHKNFEMKMRL
jgi:hypothetical protein